MSCQTLLLTNGYRRPIGIPVLCDPSSKNLPRLLKAGHIPLDHPLVEFVETGNTEAGTTPSSLNHFGTFTGVERQSRPILRTRSIRGIRISGEVQAHLDRTTQLASCRSQTQSHSSLVLALLSVRRGCFISRRASRILDSLCVLDFISTFRTADTGNASHNECDPPQAHCSVKGSPALCESNNPEVRSSPLPALDEGRGSGGAGSDASRQFPVNRKVPQQQFYRAAQFRVAV